MLTIRFQEPMDRWLKAAATAEGLTNKALAERAVERELARLSERDVTGRVLRAVGWRREKGGMMRSRTTEGAQEEREGLPGGGEG